MIKWRAAFKIRFLGQKILILRLINNLQPVSYTHLDVYKRQEVDEIFEIPFNDVFDKDNFEIREYHLQKIPRKFYAFNYKKYLIWGVTAGLIVNPVSYTHLDVYKRQD